MKRKANKIVVNLHDLLVD